MYGRPAMSFLTCLPLILLFHYMRGDGPINRSVRSVMLAVFRDMRGRWPNQSVRTLCDACSVPWHAGAMAQSLVPYALWWLQCSVTYGGDDLITRSVHSVMIAVFRDMRGRWHNQSFRTLCDDCSVPWHAGAMAQSLVPYTLWWLHCSLTCGAMA